MSDATLTRLIRPTKAHNSLYLNRQNVKNYLWLVALLPLLSGCESQAILVKKTTHTLRHRKPKHRLRQTGVPGACLKPATTGRSPPIGGLTAWAIS